MRIITVEKRIPDAYIRRIEILSITWLSEEEYRALDDFEQMRKEIDYYDIYDYRVCRVVTNQEYTQSLKQMGSAESGRHQRELLSHRKERGGEIWPAMRFVTEACLALWIDCGEDFLFFSILTFIFVIKYHAGEIL